jgi:hypothetical protein
MLLALLLAAHQGLFLRLDAGIDYVVTTRLGEAHAAFGPSASLSLGGNVADGLALFGTVLLAGTAAGSACPVSFPQPACVGDGIEVGGIGVGLNGYAMPGNVFLSGLLGVGTLDVNYGPDGRKSAGLLGRFGAGKEWLVSPHWGLGAAGYLVLGSNKEAQGGGVWVTLAPLLAFSATFY